MARNSTEKERTLMISDEHLDGLKELFKKYPHTTGSWLMSPMSNGGGIVQKPNGEVILQAPKYNDAIIAAYAGAFLRELVEEVSALRALPGDHYKEAGLQRKLTRRKELKALPDGAVIRNENGVIFEAIKVKGSRLWYEKKNSRLYRTKEIVRGKFTVIEE